MYFFFFLRKKLASKDNLIKLNLIYQLPFWIFFQYEYKVQLYIKTVSLLILVVLVILYIIYMMLKKLYNMTCVISGKMGWFHASELELSIHLLLLSCCACSFVRNKSVKHGPFCSTFNLCAELKNCTILQDLSYSTHITQRYNHSAPISHSASPYYLTHSSQHMMHSSYSIDHLYYTGILIEWHDP